MSELDLSEIQNSEKVAKTEEIAGLKAEKIEPDPVTSTAQLVGSILMDAVHVAREVLGREVSIDPQLWMRELAPITDELMAAGSYLTQLDAPGQGEEHFDGPPAVVGARLASAFRQIEADEPRQAFLANVCGEAFLRMQRSGEVGPEEMTDMIISILRELDFTKAWAAAGLLQIIPYLRAILDDDPEKDWGWHASLASLATLLSISSDHQVDASVVLPSRVFYAHYYYEILVDAIDDYPALSRGSLIEQASNNLAAAIGHFLDLRPRSSAQQDAVIEQHAQDLTGIMRKIQGIAIAVRMGETGGREIDVAALAPLRFPHGDVPALAYKVFHVIDRMSMVSSNREADSLESAFRRAAAAAGRAAMGISDRVASAFFNTGVTLRRMVRDRSKEIGNKTSANRAAVLFNALGVYWSMALNINIRDALVKGDGFDCAINLFGALDELPEARTLILNGAGELGRQLWVHGRSLSISAVDVVKLENALRDLSVDRDFSPQQLLPTEELTKLAASVVRALAQSYDLDDEPSVLATAKLVRGVFVDLAGTEAAYHALAERAWGEVDHYVQMSSDPQEVIRSVFTDKLLDDGLFKMIVDAALVTPQQMETALASRRKTFQSIGDAFWTAFSKDAQFRGGA